MFKYSLIVLLSLNIYATEIKIKNDTEGDAYKFSREIRESVSELKEKDFKFKDYYYKLTDRKGCFFEKDTPIKIMSGLTDGFYQVMDKKTNCIDYVKIENIYKDIPKEEVKPIIEEIKPIIEEVKPIIEEIKPIIEEVKPIIEEVKPIVIEPIKEQVSYNVYIIATYLKLNQLNNFVTNNLVGYKTNVVENKKGVYTLEVYLKEGTKEEQIKFVKKLSKDSKFKKIEIIEEIKTNKEVF